MEEVTRELADGLKSLGNIMKMLDEAISATTGNADCAKFKDDQDYIGFYFDEKRFFIGIGYEEPETLLFDTEPRFRICNDAKEKVDCGEVKSDEDGPYWKCELKLYSEEIRFFQLPKNEQLKCLERFLTKCLAVTESIKDR